MYTELKIKQQNDEVKAKAQNNGTMNEREWG